MTHLMDRRCPVLTFSLILFALLATGLSGCASPSTTAVRIATFNTALSRDQEGALHAAFAKGDDAKARLVAEVIQRVRPDIVLLQEVDYDPTGQAYADFQRNYLNVSQNGAQQIHYDYIYAPPVNTGVLADVDLDGDGKITRPNDCYGFGRFDGHYGMVVLSKYPINQDQVLSLREKLWKDLPDNNLPSDYYNANAQSRLRLSSKTHDVVPIQIRKNQYKLWISHPTPPVFDGPEDRNGRRNYDEIGLWLNYLNPAISDSSLSIPHSGLSIKPGDVRPHAQRFIIMGDLNADPNDGESRPNAMNRLLSHEHINNAFTPTSAGAFEAANLQAGANLKHKTDPATDTGDWNDDPSKGSGNLRVDYVLPSKDLNVTGSGVYWPTRDDPYAYLNKASDHHLVWIDIELD